MRFKNNNKKYTLVLHNKVPLELRSSIKFIGMIYTKNNGIRKFYENVFIYEDDYNMAITPSPPSYNEMLYGCDYYTYNT